MEVTHDEIRLLVDHNKVPDAIRLVRGNPDLAYQLLQCLNNRKTTNPRDIAKAQVVLCQAVVDLDQGIDLLRSMHKHTPHAFWFEKPILVLLGRLIELALTPHELLEIITLAPRIQQPRDAEEKISNFEALIEALRIRTLTIQKALQITPLDDYETIKKIAEHHEDLAWLDASKDRKRAPLAELLECNRQLGENVRQRIKTAARLTFERDEEIFGDTSLGSLLDDLKGTSCHERATKLYQSLSMDQLNRQLQSVSSFADLKEILNETNRDFAPETHEQCFRKLKSLPRSTEDLIWLVNNGYRCFNDEIEPRVVNWAKRALKKAATARATTREELRTLLTFFQRHGDRQTAAVITDRIVGKLTRVARQTKRKGSEE